MTLRPAAIEPDGMYPTGDGDKLERVPERGEDPLRNADHLDGKAIALEGLVEGFRYLWRQILHLLPRRSQGCGVGRSMCPRA
jgi:hypothetical protein